MTTCDKCHKPSTDTETVTVFLCRQTHWEPAEYEDQDWCAACRSWAEYISDPANEDYERALARGWED